jgi:PAS domain-containing protein
MISNIGKLKDLHEKLDDQTEVLYGIAEFASDGFFDWQIEKDYEYFSPRFWEILGYDPKTKKPHPSEWQAIIHPDDGKIAAGKLFTDHVKSKGGTPYQMVVRYIHGVTGQYVRILCRGKVIKWNGNKPIRMVGTHTLLSETVCDDCPNREKK